MALGGDSHVQVVDGALQIGPLRKGSAMAFGGPCPTPTDAMVFLGRAAIGDKAQAAEAIAGLARQLGQPPQQTAARILSEACDSIAAQVRRMVAEVNGKPVYTIHELLEGKALVPRQLIVVGGPAPYIADQIGASLGIAAVVPDNSDVINASGAAMARTTVELNLTADTEAQIMSVAEQGEQLKIPKRFRMDDVVAAGRERLERIARAAGAREQDLEIELTECQSFNVIRGFSTAGKNIRVRLQIKPGLIKHEPV
jgi:N-methylhydantoinase A